MGPGWMATQQKELCTKSGHQDSCPGYATKKLCDLGQITTS